MPWYGRMSLSYSLDIGTSHSWFTDERDTLIGSAIGLSYAGETYTSTIKAGRGLYSSVDGLGSDWTFTYDVSRSF